MFTGFILTDTKRLASLLSDTQYEIKRVLSSYMNSCISYISWQLIDVADSMYSYIDKSNWYEYASILNDYYYGLGKQGVSNIPLFIIGGDNVIPMPRVSSPLYGMGKEYLDVDMVYCFEPKEDLQFEDYISSLPRFAVGRLPLADNWDLETLKAYLDDCVGYVENGIPSRGAAMITTESWLRASAEMMRGIPLVSLSEDYVYLNNGMLVSPEFSTEDTYMYNNCVHELKKVDFLVCNLHGSDEYGCSYFVGEDEDREIYPVTLQPAMFQETTPYIINTVACFGARYINYEMEDSMLLSAMSYGTMLYCGSCEIALGGYDMEGNSELLMKLYNIYLHQGIPAGMALLKAKQDYYRTCHDEDGDEFAMFTILEFNLFGCPILYMQPKLNANYHPQLLGQNVVTKAKASYNPVKIVPVKDSVFETNDVLSYVRSKVDANLSYIKAKVEKDVYERLGLSGSNISQVSYIMINNRQVGWQFMYMSTSQESYRNFRMYYLVNTDEQGEITKIIRTK